MIDGPTPALCNEEKCGRRSCSSRQRQPFYDYRTLRACVCRNERQPICVCACACVYVCVVVSVCLLTKEKKRKTFFSLIYKLREEKRWFPRARERGCPPLLLRVKMYERTERPNAQGHRRKLFKKRQKISVRMQGLLWCCAAACAPRLPTVPSSARVVVGKHRSIYNYMCLCEEEEEEDERHYEPLNSVQLFVT